MPKLVELAVDAYVLFDHAYPDRAGPWIDEEPDDPNAAYLLDLYETSEQARAAMPSRADRTATEIHREWPSPTQRASAVEDIERGLTVRRVTTRGVRGRDYRYCCCDGLPQAVAQIRKGRQVDGAWREILRQRLADEVGGALLPGATSAGTLFIFIAAGGLDIGAPLEGEAVTRGSR